MRLINSKTLELREFFEPVAPPYAILSHTWENEEVSFQDLTDFHRRQPQHHYPALQARDGFQKIVHTCRLAQDHSIDWVWVDTCCIDKSSSAELTETINSMFRWYQKAVVCFAYLGDLSPADDLQDSLQNCRWFTRGWTLQELIAPSVVNFYDQRWNIRGTKQSLASVLSGITAIEERALLGAPLHAYRIAVRMSWAAKRVTSRPEDMAYCLLGIFDVNIPLIYGEGIKAFRRLQEAIIRQSSDMSIFAWEDGTAAENTCVGTLLSPSPAGFGFVSTWTQSRQNQISYLFAGNSELTQEYSITNRGMRIEGSIVHLPVTSNNAAQTAGALCYFLELFQEYGFISTLDGVSSQNSGFSVGILLQKIGPHLYARKSGLLTIIPVDDVLEASQTTQQVYFVRTDYRGSTASEISALYRSIVLPVGDEYFITHVSKAIPESHWDETNRLFFRCSTKDLVFAAMVVVSIEGSSMPLIVVIDQRHLPPASHLFHPDAHPDLHRWLYREKHAREPQDWNEFSFKLGAYQDLDSMADTHFEIGDRLFRIAASIKDRTVDTTTADGVIGRLRQHYLSLAVSDSIEWSGT